MHGRSGAGKTTLLNTIGGLERPTTGNVWVDGQEVTALRDEQLLTLRRRSIGFVFQAFGLLPILSAAEKVEIPLRLARATPQRRRARVAELLASVGLGDRAGHRPHELSGGEQQRVAVARALANNPVLLLADEPTGQLDSDTARTIMDLLLDVVATHGVTAIVATHDATLIDMAHDVIELRDGHVIS